MILSMNAVGVGFVRSIALAALAAMASACASSRPVVLPAGGWPQEAVTRIMEATIVDLDPESGKVTVKDRDRWETWTVAVTSETWVAQEGAGLIEIGALEVGDRIRVTGRVRVPLIITASDVVRLAAAGAP